MQEKKQFVLSINKATSPTVCLGKNEKIYYIEFIKNPENPKTANVLKSDLFDYKDRQNRDIKVIGKGIDIIFAIILVLNI